MPFKAIRENKILAKISGFTVLARTVDIINGAPLELKVVHISLKGDC